MQKVLDLMFNRVITDKELDIKIIDHIKIIYCYKNPYEIRQ